MASLSQGRTAAAHCGLFTHKSVPVIFEPPCISYLLTYLLNYLFTYLLTYLLTPWSRVLLEKLTGFQLVKKFLHILSKPKVRYRSHLSLSCHQSISSGPRLTLRLFYGEKFLAPCPTPKLEDQTLSAIRYCLFNTFAATLHNGSRSSIRNLRTRHAVVTGTQLSWFLYSVCTVIRDYVAVLCWYL